MFLSLGEITTVGLNGLYAWVDTSEGWHSIVNQEGNYFGELRDACIWRIKRVREGVDTSFWELVSIKRVRVVEIQEQYKSGSQNECTINFKWWEEGSK